MLLHCIDCFIGGNYKSILIDRRSLFSFIFNLDFLHNQCDQKKIAECL